MREDHPSSARDAVLWETSPQFQAMWAQGILDFCRTGEERQCGGVAGDRGGVRRGGEEPCRRGGEIMWHISVAFLCDFNELIELNRAGQTQAEKAYPEHKGTLFDAIDGDPDAPCNTARAFKVSISTHCHTPEITQGHLFDCESYMLVRGICKGEQFVSS